MQRFVKILFVVVSLITPGLAAANTAWAENPSPHRIVVLSDTHLPGNLLPQKEQALQTINSWDDVELVVVTGDMVARGGSVAEYAAARKFFDQLKKPAAFVIGNHDYIYPDTYTMNPETGHHRKESDPEMRRAKINRFRETWGLRDIYYSRRLGRYHLIFLSADHLTSNDYVRLSDEQMAWFSTELSASAGTPTIVFCHAPLAGTFRAAKILQDTAADSHVAEPQDRIAVLLKQHLQVRLWVSGHLHLAPTNDDARAAYNFFEGRVLNLHNPDMDGRSTFSVNARGRKHETIWSRSLYLHSDRIVIRTYDHRQNKWLEALDRFVEVPPLP